MRIAHKVAEDPTVFWRLFPGLLAAQSIPFLLIHQFDLAGVLHYPLIAVSILSSFIIAYLAGIVIRVRRYQNGIR